MSTIKDYIDKIIDAKESLDDALTSKNIKTSVDNSTLTNLIDITVDYINESSESSTAKDEELTNLKSEISSFNNDLYTRSAVDSTGLDIYQLHQQTVNSIDGYENRLSEKDSYIDDLDDEIEDWTNYSNNLVSVLKSNELTTYSSASTGHDLYRISSEVETNLNVIIEELDGLITPI